MKKSLAFSLLAAAQSFLPNQAMAADPDCKGNGCDSLSFVYASGCCKIRNISGQPVRWSWGIYSGRLKPTEATTLLLPNGQCNQMLIGERTAQIDT